VVAKLLPPHNLSPKDVAESEGISLPTVYKWRSEARAEGRCLPDAGSGTAESWSARDKFAAVMESASLNEHDLGEYCRKRGLHRAQLEQWRKDCQDALGRSASTRDAEEAAAKRERKRIRTLEKELKRKDAALAETAALLALRKKAAAIWGDEDA
jgi:transposase-like protein